MSVLLYNYQPFLKDCDKQNLYNLYLNGLSTKHNRYDGCAISRGYVEAAGYCWKNFKRFVHDNNLGTWEKDAVVGRFNQGRGSSKVFIPSNKGLNIYHKAMKWLRKQKTITFCRYFQRQLSQETKHYPIRRDKTPINIEALETFKRNNPEFTKSVDIILAGTKDGYFEHLYYRNRTGRYTAMGNTLQNAPTEVREIALKGCYVYDIKSCQWNILHQISKGSNLLDKYVHNPAKYKQAISEATGLTLKQSKKAVTAKLFGAGNSGKKGTAFYNVCKEDGKINKEKLDKLITNNWLNDLEEELNRLAPEVRVAYKEVGLSGWDRKALAYILQRQEVKVIEALMSTTNPVLLLHDAIVTTEKQDVDKLQQVIYDRTGYKLEIEERKL